MIKDRRRIICAALVIAAVLLPPRFVYGQRGGSLPQWVDEGWRSARYPQSEWYVGFSQDAVKKGASAAEAQKRVEREAQSRMAEGITVRIAAVSTTQTQSVQARDAAGNVKETVNKEYGQIIEASTTAEIAKAELHSFHDKASGRVYAFAAVKMSELAAYYISRIEHYLRAAENDLTLAKQFAGMDRKGSALERLAESRKNIGECGKYHELLIAVDYKGGAAKRLTDRGAAMTREISAMEVSLREAGAVFVTGKETLAGQPVTRVTSALQSRMSQNKCRVANDPKDAGFILELEVKDCNAVQGGSFHYCNACVRAELLNAKTGKSETVISFTGPKVGWTAANIACEKAFDQAVEELWKSIRDKTEICK